jgi:hypothetical protein
MCAITSLLRRGAGFGPSCVSPAGLPRGERGFTDSRMHFATVKRGQFF